jgi:hypothetical protein
MLIDSLPTKATSSFEVSHAREYDELTSAGRGTPRGEWRRMPDKAGGSLMSRANAVSARDTHDNPQLVRKPSDWTAGSRASLVQHGPSKTVFEISARPDLGPDDVLTLQDFRARPVHGGAAAPANADLEVLSGEAVLMALFLVGLAWPVVVN